MEVRNFEFENAFFFIYRAENGTFSLAPQIGSATFRIKKNSIHITTGVNEECPRSHVCCPSRRRGLLFLPIGVQYTIFQMLAIFTERFTYFLINNFSTYFHSWPSITNLFYYAVDPRSTELMWGVTISEQIKERKQVNNYL